MFNRKTYLEKLFKFTSDTAEKEIKKICMDLNFNPNNYTIWINNAGFSYTIGKIAQDIYFSQKPICDIIRQKLFLLNIVIETTPEYNSILRLNTNIKKEKKDSWAQNQEIRKKEKTIKEILKKVDLVYQNES